MDPGNSTGRAYIDSNGAAAMAAAASTILVVYAGPSTPKTNQKTELYIKNMEFFLRNGIDCRTQDTVIVAGRGYYFKYFPLVQQLNRQCQTFGSKVILVPRREECYDMEAAYLTVSGGVPGLRDVKSYDYFFFVNCSMTGPALTSTTRPGPWTSQFKRLIDNRVKMTELNLNCR